MRINTVKADLEKAFSMTIQYVDKSYDGLAIRVRCSITPITFSLLKKLSDYFFTEEIDVSDNETVSEGGCETCAFDVNYATIYVRNPKRNA